MDRDGTRTACTSRWGDTPAVARCLRALGRDTDAATTAAGTIAVLETLGAAQVLEEAERPR